MKIKLSDADRERLGCPEWIDASVDTLPVREAEALEEATGIAYADALDLFVPKSVQVDDTTWRYSWKPKGMRLMVWLGLRRADVHVPFDELDFDFRYIGAGWHTLVTEPEPGGKGDGSLNAEPDTPSTSRTSSRRTRSKKSPTST